MEPPFCEHPYCVLHVNWYSDQDEVFNEEQILRRLGLSPASKTIACLHQLDQQRKKPRIWITRRLHPPLSLDFLLGPSKIKREVHFPSLPNPLARHIPLWPPRAPISRICLAPEMDTNTVRSFPEEGDTDMEGIPFSLTDDVTSSKRASYLTNPLVVVATFWYVLYLTQ